MVFNVIKHQIYMFLAHHQKTASARNNASNIQVVWRVMRKHGFPSDKASNIHILACHEKTCFSTYKSIKYCKSIHFRTRYIFTIFARKTNSQK